MKHKYPFFILLFVSVFISISNIYSEIPAGYYYFARGKSKAELKTALKNISTPLRVFEYGSGPGYTWQGFFFADKRTDSTVIDMYSNIIRKQTSFEAVNGMHIEHSFPKSWWGGSEIMAYKDLFHLYPADGVTNSTKNNLPLGEVTETPTFDNGVSKIGKNSFGTVYTDNCFEPADEYKGDFARSYLYISTIYEDYFALWQSPMLNNNTYPVWKPWAIDLLLKWHRQDPVSVKEIDRNEAVFKMQNNRNPFIDYPALAEYIWGADTTKNFPFPVESQAFLINPRRGTTIDFGIIMTNSSAAYKLRFEGVNLAGNVNFSIKNNSGVFHLSTNTLSAQSVLDGADLDVYFQPVNDGVARDTLIVSGGGLSSGFEVPVFANAVSEFIALEPTNVTPLGGKLRWIANPDATNYKLTLFQSEQKAGDLLISSYIEGSSWNKAIELYNGTGRSIDLSKYSLRKQSNGDGAFGTVLKLSGQLQSGSTYKIVHKSATNQALLSNYNLLTDSLLQINGNDAIALTHSGLIIDMVGEANAGANVIWGLDMSLQRKSLITHPSATFNKDDWNVFPLDFVTFWGNHSMIFDAAPEVVLSQIYTGNVTNYDITDLVPDSKYTYKIEAIKDAVTTETQNTVQLHTKKLEAPELLDTDSIKDDGFIIRWEKDIYADSYLVDLFSVGGIAETTTTEPFDNVGTSGTPLPTGWTSSALSTYTSTTSSGGAIPSMQLNDNTDWLATKLYDAPVTKLSFMYRFPSGATGSTLLLEALQNTQWVQVTTINSTNNTKTYPVFNFTVSQNYRKFRFTYNKVSGNLAIDDVSATFGNPDTTFIVKSGVAVNNFFRTNSLHQNSNYLFRIQSKRGAAISPYSVVKEQKTSVTTSDKFLSPNKYLIVNSSEGIVVKNTNPEDVVSLFNFTGSLIFTRLAAANQVEINSLKNGAYILQIRTKNGVRNYKLLH